MLQIDHIYEFLHQELFKDLEFWNFPGGVLPDEKVHFDTLFTRDFASEAKIFFYDQEPLIDTFLEYYLDMFIWERKYTMDEHLELHQTKNLPYDLTPCDDAALDFLLKNTKHMYKKGILATSEKSPLLENYINLYDLKQLYYFFHGFAALDWYRGFYALNYSKKLKMHYQHDFVSFNRIINDDRSYRIYFVSQLEEFNLLDCGQVSFGVTDYSSDWRDEVSSPDTKLSEHARCHAERYLTNINKLTIDSPCLPGSASADIPREVDALWNVVTETVFYYDKLHLTEKIFKPIVMKQPFMLIAAPGNLAYLRSYGFKTFEGIIDESYDLIQDNDARIDAVVKQLTWYCTLSDSDKKSVISAVNDIVEYNFRHFYGEFKHIITQELLANTKSLFKELNYDYNHINFDDLYHILTR